MRATRATAAAAAVALCLSGCASDLDPLTPAADDTTAPAPGQTAAVEGGLGAAQAAKGKGPLKGMETAKVEETLGPPSFRRSDGPSEWLQYRSASCVLDIFLYREAGEETARVAHIEARTSRLDPMPEATCLQSLTPPKPAPRRR
ncbi:MAG: hypothetical protein KF815_12530 [Rhodospirillales bacterium]|nr:hypothetical protein [Rhodospirillales bacterium]